MTDTPRSLLERLREPLDQDAWAQFVDLYTPVIHACARRLGLSDPDAQDLVQEVFTTLVRVLPTFRYDRQRNFGRWLWAVTRNKWRDRCKRQAREPAAGGALPDVAGPGELEELWEAEYRRQLVSRALQVMQADFHPTTWRACWEHAALGRPAAEVAAELGMTTGAVYAATFRILGRLRQELAGMLD